jgi:hypothetical protein
LQEYRQAGAEYDLDWTYLAGIGKVETRHGTYNPYGGDCIYGPPTRYGRAKGPMQFIDSTWATFGIDGDGDSVADACNFRDAIPAAARYLDASGAPEDYYSAVYAYNHSEEYVSDVFYWADRYRGSSGGGDDGDGGEYTPELEIGQEVVSTADINVRSSAEVKRSNVKHTQPEGMMGTVANGYVTKDDYLWWWIHWENGIGGWSVQRYLDGSTSSSSGSASVLDTMFGRL